MPSIYKKTRYIGNFRKVLLEDAKQKFRKNLLRNGNEFNTGPVLLFTVFIFTGCI